MDYFTSILVALFCITVVFVVLAILYFLIRLFTAVVGKMASRLSNTPVLNESAPEPAFQLPITAEIGTPARVVQNASAGVIKLNNVDAKTAAMVMAIVSHETEIPLSNLQFKSIRCVDE